MTNYIETYQREGKCDEVKIIYELNQIKMIKIILYNINKKKDDTKRYAICRTDDDCKNKTLLNLWNGKYINMNH